MPLTKLVAEQIRRHDMIAEGEKVVAGVSGGYDSVALLHILCRLREEFGFQLVVAHLEHGFRGAESEADAAFVADLAARMQLEAHVESRDVPAYSARHGLPAQVAAREMRYGFLNDVALRTGASKVALGHHADDQAETILLHLLRGAGLSGLGGMSPVRDGFYIRPLLNIRRRDIEAYCRRHRLTARQDSSNFKPKYLRNKIRLELVPVLEREYNPNLTEVLVRLGEICRDEDAYLASEAGRIFIQARKPAGETAVALDREKLLGLPEALLRRVIRLAWSELRGSKDDLSFGHINQIMEIIKGGGGFRQIDLPKGITCTNSYHRVEFTLERAGEEVPFYQHQLKVPGITAVPEAGLAIGARLLPAAQAQNPASMGPDEVLLDYDRLAMPLIVRRRLDGDRFTPLGLEGKMKLKKFFIEQKVPRRLRDRLPLVVSGKEIAWVTGLRPAEQFKVTENTTTCLHLFIHDYRESFCDKLIQKSSPLEK